MPLLVICACTHTHTHAHTCTHTYTLSFCLSLSPSPSPSPSPSLSPPQPLSRPLFHPVLSCFRYLRLSFLSYHGPDTAVDAFGSPLQSIPYYKITSLVVSHDTNGSHALFSLPHQDSLTPTLFPPPSSFTLLPCLPTHTCTQTHAHTHAHTRTHTHTHAHTRTHTRVRAQASARCYCSGHGSTCERVQTDNGLQSVCMCDHNTMGATCDTCMPLFNNRPFARGTVGAANECQRCECNGHAGSCTYSSEDSIGVCDNCQNNTVRLQEQTPEQRKQMRKGLPSPSPSPFTDPLSLHSFSPPPLIALFQQCSLA